MTRQEKVELAKIAQLRRTERKIKEVFIKYVLAQKHKRRYEKAEQHWSSQLPDVYVIEKMWWCDLPDTFILKY